LAIGVDAHAAEILPKAGFHEAACARFKRLAAAAVARDLLHGVRHAANRPRRLALHPGALQLCLFIILAAAARPPAGTFALNDGHISHVPLDGAVTIVLLGLDERRGMGR
jgi:hypothetical protein